MHNQWILLNFPQYKTGIFPNCKLWLPPVMGKKSNGIYIAERVERMSFRPEDEPIEFCTSVLSLMNLRTCSHAFFSGQN